MVYTNCSRFNCEIIKGRVEIETQVPLYQQIEDTIRKMISGIEYEPGDRIPSERELADRLNASRMTVRHAVERMTEQGLLERRSTSGTFVSEPNVVRSFFPDSVQSLTRLIQEKGNLAGSKLLSFGKISAPSNVARDLSLSGGGQVFRIERLRFTNNIPFCIETSFLPESMVEGLSETDVSGQDSLYDYLKDRFGITPARSSDKLSISKATKEEAELLGLEQNGAVLYFRSVVFDSKGNPFEFVKSINHPDKVVFQSESAILTKNQ